MSGYGKEGDKYLLNDVELYINDKFLFATLMAIIMVISSNDQSGMLDTVIERVAEGIYGQLTKTGPEGTEQPTEPTGGNNEGGERA
jgi:hypothetical protein